MHGNLPCIKTESFDNDVIEKNSNEGGEYVNETDVKDDGATREDFLVTEIKEGFLGRDIMTENTELEWEYTC